MDDAGALLTRAGERLRLSGEHTVVALAGGTGSGKSSLFNAVCGTGLSPTGVRRPMTSHAARLRLGRWTAPGRCSTGSTSTSGTATPAPARSTAARRGGSLQGLVLLDLPDHDSVRAAHIAEVDTTSASRT